MPTYPTGAQNLDLLESLKENYSQYMPGFQGDPNSVTDFMRHLGGQGVEGMGVGKENRADLLGLNNQASALNNQGYDPSTLKEVYNSQYDPSTLKEVYNSQNDQDDAFPTMDYLNILTGESPRGPRNDLETQNRSTPTIAPRSTVEEEQSRFNLPELSGGLLDPNKMSSLLAEQFAPTKKELTTS